MNMQNIEHITKIGVRSRSYLLNIFHHVLL